MPKWRNEYRRCDNCRREYQPQREAQTYCSPDCRRAAAYGREVVLGLTFVLLGLIAIAAYGVVRAVERFSR